MSMQTAQTGIFRRATYGQPLSVVRLAGSEEGVERVVSGDGKAGQVGQELTTEVEDDEEEVQGNGANDGVCLWDAGLLLEILQGRILGQLSICVSGCCDSDPRSCSWREGTRDSWARFIQLGADGRPALVTIDFVHTSLSSWPR